MAKILIVEDDQALYNLYATEFSLRGHETTWAKDGEEGLVKAKSGQFKLVLLDIMLPKANGLDILAQLKQDPTTKTLPVMMLTNFGNEENVKRALESGAEDFILKYKIVPSEVVDKVEAALGQKKDKAVPITTE